VDPTGGLLEFVIAELRLESLLLPQQDRREQKVLPSRWAAPENAAASLGVRGTHGVVSAWTEKVVETAGRRRRPKPYEERAEMFGVFSNSPPVCSSTYTQQGGGLRHDSGGGPHLPARKSTTLGASCAVRRRSNLSPRKGKLAAALL
jgi:hypothetical protein